MKQLTIGSLLAVADLPFGCDSIDKHWLASHRIVNDISRKIRVNLFFVAPTLIMAQLVRTLMTALACALIALGQTPALVHQTHCCVDSPKPVTAHSCQACCCTTAAEEDTRETPAPDHDEDSCHICQSLYTAFSHVVVIDDFAVSQACTQYVAAATLVNARACDFEFPSPRGPPAL